jgi:hypothetical protein
MGRMFGHVTSSTCTARLLSFNTVGGAEIASSVNVAPPFSATFSTVILYSGSGLDGAGGVGAAGDAAVA